MTTGGPARIQLSRRPGWQLPGTGRARQAPRPITQAAGARRALLRVSLEPQTEPAQLPAQKQRLAKLAV